MFFFFGSILHLVGMHSLLLLSAAALGLRLLAYLVRPRLGWKLSCIDRPC